MGSPLFESGRMRAIVGGIAVGNSCFPRGLPAPLLGAPFLWFVEFGYDDNPLTFVSRSKGVAVLIRYFPVDVSRQRRRRVGASRMTVAFNAFLPGPAWRAVSIRRQRQYLC